MSRQRLQGIVVGTTQVGESHLIVRVLSADKGKVSVMARGARSSKRRFAGCFELGTQLVLETQKGRGELMNVVTASVQSAPKRARDDLLCLAYLAYACDVCSNLTAEDQESNQHFQLLQAWLQVLESEPGPSMASRIAFEAKALTFSGLRPHLMHCAQCGGAIENGVRFSDAHGGAVHTGCGYGEEIASEVLHKFERLRRTPLIDTVHETIENSGVDLLAAFLQHHIGRRLRSYGWLREVEELDHRTEHDA